MRGLATLLTIVISHDVSTFQLSRDEVPTLPGRSLRTRGNVHRAVQLQPGIEKLLIYHVWAMSRTFFFFSRKFKEFRGCLFQFQQSTNKQQKDPRLPREPRRDKTTPISWRVNMRIAGLLHIRRWCIWRQRGGTLRRWTKGHGAHNLTGGGVCFTSISLLENRKVMGTSLGLWIWRWVIFCLYAHSCDNFQSRSSFKLCSSFLGRVKSIQIVIF
jgi:hypothetical protein